MRMSKENARWKKALLSEECPSLDRLLAALDAGPLEPDLQQHLTSCPRCSAEAAMLREFEEGQSDPGRQAAVDWIVQRLKEHGEEAIPASRTAQAAPSPGAWSAVVAWLAGLGWKPLAPLAVALLLVVGARLWTPGLPPVGEISEPTVRSADLKLVAPLGTLSVAPERLQWESPPEATSFQVRILEVDRTLLWEGTSPTTSLELPAPLRSQMTVGRRFFWQVVALDAQGHPIKESQLADFQIRSASGSE